VSIVVSGDLGQMASEAVNVQRTLMVSLLLLLPPFPSSQAKKKKKNQRQK